MASKKIKGTGGKIASKREEPRSVSTGKAAEAPPIEKPRVPERIQEKEPGFTVIKVAAVVVIALIVGVSILSRIYGGAEAGRGSEGQDERCENTQECKPGYVCHAHGYDAERCLKLCEVADPQSCEPGYTCVSSAKASGRKKVRVTAVCVPDAKAKN